MISSVIGIRIITPWASFCNSKIIVIVSLEDRMKLKLDDVLSGRLLGSAHSLREGDVNPAAPACTESSNVKLGKSTQLIRTEPTSLSTFTLILPHKLLNRNWIRTP